MTVQTVKCVNHAPSIYYQQDGYHHVMQGNCRSWNCPRCSQIRAKQEYHRMIAGVERLVEDGHDVFFWTLTCRGKELMVHDAIRGYYTWTTRLLNACRNRCKRSDGYWAYVQVTERQKRGHPHSHLICTFCPDDAEKEVKLTKDGKKYTAMRSEWFIKRNISAGLGEQCEITEIVSPRGVAGYVAKYLFKDATNCIMPKRWRRVRYSRNWYKPTKNECDGGFAITSIQHWHKIGALRVTVHTNDLKVFIDAREHGVTLTLPSTD